MDCLARYGGDEFAVVFPDSALSDAARIVERLRAALPDTAFCAGVAAYTPGDDRDTFISRADRQLYNLKRSRQTQCTDTGDQGAATSSPAS